MPYTLMKVLVCWAGEHVLNEEWD